jgi:NRAMP (natural resistance-associated macrophage protein)-like metal ion transporter
MSENGKSSRCARLRTLARQLGPGLITGAADDDPSGIATYSQAGAQFGYGMLWSLLLTLPLMAGIQLVAARIGCVTGRGVAANIRQHYPPSLLYALVTALLVANTINIGADIGAMAEALKLVAGGPAHLYSLMFGAICVLLQVFMPYHRYAPLLKWSTLSLFAYVATLFVVDVPWAEVARRIVAPGVDFGNDYLLALVAVLGTTISPYLFFWQASQEVEDQQANGHPAPLIKKPRRAVKELGRIEVDTYVGMAFSNFIAFCIMLTSAIALHANGITDIRSAADAANALRPVAGDSAFLFFSFGIIGTGMLAIPVLAGSAAYAVAEAFRWPRGLARLPLEAPGFYGIIVAATVIGIAIDFSHVDPFKALIWAAVINGIVAVPVMVVMMRLAARRDVMGKFAISRGLAWTGWASTCVMAVAVGALLVSLA